MWVREGICDRIVEIMNLSNLTYLDLHVPRYDVIPKGFSPRNLKGFVIQIGGDFGYYSEVNIKRRHLVITDGNVEIPFLKLLKQLTETSFNELEHIWLEYCPDVSCLVDTANWDQLHTMNSSKHVGEANIMEKFFEKLKHLDLNVLDGMEVLWKCPNQYIYGCESLKKWGPGIHETPKLKFVNYDVPLDGPQSIKDAIPKCCYEAE
ncbi:hypothetical protein Tco_1486793 [Tanacetum coccineum]